MVKGQGVTKELWSPASAANGLGSQTTTYAAMSPAWLGLGQWCQLSNSCPHCLLCFQLRTSQGKPNMFSKPTTSDASFLVSLLSTSPHQISPVRKYLNLFCFFFFFTIKLSHSSLVFESLPDSRDGSWLPLLLSNLWINSFCSHFSGLHLFLQGLLPHCS